MDDVPVRIQVIEATPELASINFDDISDAQAADESLTSHSGPVRSGTATHWHMPVPRESSSTAVPMGLTDPTRRHSLQEVPLSRS